MERSLVAIVNKYPTNMTVLKELFVRNKIKNIILTTNEKLFKFLDTTIPELIILYKNNDYQNDFEVCRYLKGKKMLEDIPVIVVENKSRRQEIISGLGCGLADYILAPFDSKDFLSRIKNQIKLSVKRKKKEGINLLKEQMFSIVIHDLRSPFISINGFSNLIYTEIEDLTKNEIKEMAESINFSSKTALIIMENYLEWVKLKINKIEFEPEFIYLARSLKNTIDLCSLEAKKKNIVIDNKLLDKSFAYTDSHLLEIVIRNLLSNSIKFSHPNGRIVVTSENQINEVVISVADYGIGINEIKINKFLQSNDSFLSESDKNENGMGIGLHLCKELVKVQSGKIWVKSEINKKTEFFISLPLN